MRPCVMHAHHKTRSVAAPASLADPIHVPFVLEIPQLRSIDRRRFSPTRRINHRILPAMFMPASRCEMWSCRVHYNLWVTRFRRDLGIRISYATRQSIGCHRLTGPIWRPHLAVRKQSTSVVGGWLRQSKFPTLS
jgi:hypothetical protein